MVGVLETAWEAGRIMCGVLETDSLGSRRLSSSLRRSWQRHSGREDEQLIMTDKDLQQQKAVSRSAWASANQ